MMLVVLSLKRREECATATPIGLKTPVPLERLIGCGPDRWATLLGDLPKGVMPRNGRAVMGDGAGGTLAHNGLVRSNVRGGGATMVLAVLA